VISLLRRPVLPGYSAIQFGILMNYTYILLYGLFRESNPFTDGTRSAWISVCQLPLVFALAQKSNFLGTLLGYGYESVSFRRLCVLMSTLIKGSLSLAELLPSIRWYHCRLDWKHPLRLLQYVP
jgi:hypothetical protein